MTFEEKLTWVNASVTLVVAAAYFITVGGQLGATPVTQIAYQIPMLVAMGSIVVLTIAGTIAMSIGTAVGAAIGARVAGEADAERAAQDAVKDIDRKDERDVHIDQRGDRVAYTVTSALVVGVLALTMLGYPHFWIANALFASFVIAGLASSATKIVAYRRGF